MNKKLLFIGIVFFTIVAVAAYFASRTQQQPIPPPPKPTPYSLPTVNSWNGVVPGASTAQDLTIKLGGAVSVTQNGSTTTYSYPSANQYWKNEVDVTGSTVVFIRERVFPPANTSFKNLSTRLTEKPIALFGPDHQSGTLLYVYPAEGIAYLANSFRNAVYQIWRFAPTTIDSFISLPQAAGYGTVPAGQPEGI